MLVVRDPRRPNVYYLGVRYDSLRLYRYPLDAVLSFFSCFLLRLCEYPACSVTSIREDKVGILTTTIFSHQCFDEAAVDLI